MLLRARIVLPISAPPIEDGVVLIQDGRIAEVGRSRDIELAGPEEVLDLGEVILLPGLVNAHCHLDYSAMAGRISPPREFLDWIEAIIAYKASWDYSDFAHSWVSGAGQLLKNGVTTVADMEAVPELIPECQPATPLRIHAFMELINLRKRSPGALMVEEAERTLLGHLNPRGGYGLAPHALYTASPDLLQAASVCAQSNDWPLSIHVAESRIEAEMFRDGRGLMFDWLRKNQRDMSDCGRHSPVAILEQLGLLSNHLLAVHCNYLEPGDAELLGKNQCTVVHCPQSHAYFGHADFQARELAAVGVNLCLGTDSLASTRKQRGMNPELSLYDEMRVFADNHPDFSPEEILPMATIHGALALRRANQIGEIAGRALADLQTIPYSGPLEAATQFVVHETIHSSRVMIGGHWVNPLSAAAQ